MTDASKIDAAINAMKAKKAKKDPNAPVEDTEDKPKRTRLTPEQRTERDTQREIERIEKKEARDQAKSEKEAKREADRKPAHMAKVEKAAEKLPALTAEAQGFYDQVTKNLNAAEIFAMTENFRHFVRMQRTEAALNTKLNKGDQVTIVSGNPRFIGCLATVTKPQRIRCYVEVEGYDKPIYLFTSDVELVEAAPQALPELDEDDQAGEQIAATG